MVPRRPLNAVSIVPSLSSLIDQVRTLLRSARQAAATHVNILQVRTNFEIGHLIVEHEQAGIARAVYGAKTPTHLSSSLTAEFGRGFSEVNLSNMRKFYLLWRDCMPILQKPSKELPAISEKASRKSAPRFNPFTLGWSHYVVLLSIKDPKERRFYEIEAAQSGWSIPEFKRQLNSGLYERLALGRNKKRIRKLAEEGYRVSQPSDLMKEPLVLKFLGLEEKPSYSESDLESAIIDKLQHFLLELGKGFLFEARQKRFTFDEDHFFVDLVFYNRLLSCYVLVDLKRDKLTHQDLGQMQMYVNHFDRDVKTAGENPTIGILLCKRKKEALIQLTLPKNANIFASPYQLYLPSKEDLRRRLLEWTRDDQSAPNPDATLSRLPMGQVARQPR